MLLIWDRFACQKILVLRLSDDGRLWRRRMREFKTVTNLNFLKFQNKFVRQLKRATVNIFKHLNWEFRALSDQVINNSKWLPWLFHHDFSKMSQMLRFKVGRRAGAASYKYVLENIRTESSILKYFTMESRIKLVFSPNKLKAKKRQVEEFIVSEV